MSNSRKSLQVFIEETHIKFSELIQQAESKIKQIEDSLESVSDNKDDAQILLGNIQQVKTDANNLLTDITGFQTTFETLKKQLEDEDDGVEAHYNWTKENYDKTTEFKDTSATHLEAIEKVQRQAEALKKKIAEYEETTTGYKNKIQETYNFMNGQGLAHSFYERKNEIDKTLNFWKWGLVISVSLLIALVILMLFWPPKFLDQFNKVDSWLSFATFFLFRIFLASPLIFTTWYASAQYARERNEISQYAFKGGVAKALENYTDLLTDKFHDKKGEFFVRDKILDFTISSMKSIYENPHTEKQKLKKSKDWTFETGKKEIEKFHAAIIQPVAKIAKDIKSSVIN